METVWGILGQISHLTGIQDVLVCPHEKDFPGQIRMELHHLMVVWIEGENPGGFWISAKEFLSACVFTFYQLDVNTTLPQDLYAIDIWISEKWMSES